MIALFQTLSKTNKIFFFVCLGIIIISCAAFSNWFIGQEKYIHYWDSAQYYNSTITLSRYIRSNSISQSSKYFRLPSVKKLPW